MSGLDTSRSCSTDAFSKCLWSSFDFWAQLQASVHFRERTSDWPRSPRRRSEDGLAMSTCGTSSSPDKLALLSPPCSRPAAASASKRFTDPAAPRPQQGIQQSTSGSRYKPDFHHPAQAAPTGSAQDRSSLKVILKANSDVAAQAYSRTALQGSSSAADGTAICWLPCSIASRPTPINLLRSAAFDLAVPPAQPCLVKWLTAAHSNQPMSDYPEA